jgi:GntR family transcriptional regulator / MocR family aminotransferase
MHSLGARVIPVRVDSQGLVVEDLPDDTRLIYVSPAHQFPLGMPMSLPRRIELLAWAGEHDAAIIEDDCDSEFRFGGRPAPTLTALDTQGRVLYVGTFSKTMLPAIRLGFVIAPKPVRRALRLAKYVSDLPVGGLECRQRAELGFRRLRRGDLRTNRGSRVAWRPRPRAR